MPAGKIVDREGAFGAKGDLYHLLLLVLDEDGGEYDSADRKPVIDKTFGVAFLEIVPVQFLLGDAYIGGAIFLHHHQVLQGHSQQLQLTVAVGVINIFMVLKRNLREYALVGIWGLLAVAASNDSTVIIYSCYGVSLLILGSIVLNGLRSRKRTFSSM